MDKKSDGREKLKFIFIQKPGYPYIKEVTIQQIHGEILRQSTKSGEDQRG